MYLIPLCVAIWAKHTAKWYLLEKLSICSSCYKTEEYLANTQVLFSHSFWQRFSSTIILREFLPIYPYTLFIIYYSPPTDCWRRVFSKNLDDMVRRRKFKSKAFDQSDQSSLYLWNSWSEYKACFFFFFFFFDIQYLQYSIYLNVW